ncbi:olfactory receptor 6M1-like [Anomaloglossus baeobatrachus]|uniref:olfactory receptor 6M1-like n=1 Tax=Anomaloglossus baeobatrachus TaxID=238106 RepID=UPI003F4F770D
MEQLNKTIDLYGDFFLVGFSDLDQYRIYLFILFLIIYLSTLSGNTIIILVVWSNINLQSPMYFFITVLSFLDVCYVSTTVPKLLSILLTNNKRISFQGCFAQLYMFHSLGIIECALLAIMAFDRCVAIYNPLRYTSILTERVCKVLISTCWSYGFLVAIMPVTLTVRVPYCKSHDLTHFFCDLAPLMAIVCVDTTPINAANQSVSTVATFFILLFVITMYIIIIYSILKLKTSQGYSKAFSTCSSHLTVVILFYGTTFIVYVVPKEFHTAENDRIYAMVYTMFIPLLNPLIYSLRNKDVKGGFKKSLKKLQEHVCKR